MLPARGPFGAIQLDMRDAVELVAGGLAGSSVNTHLREVYSPLLLFS